MGKFNGKVAVITGGARGVGRSHAVTFAKEGADIVILDIAAKVETVEYAAATEGDLYETVKLVEQQGRKCQAFKADVRDPVQVQSAVEHTISQFGKIDFLLPNAGVLTFAKIGEMSFKMWQEMIGINLTGVFNALNSTIPFMLKQKYGRIVVTSSTAGRFGFPTLGHYCASKWGVIGLIRSVAREVGEFGITVNVVAPNEINTPMVMNEGTYHLFRPDLEKPGPDDLAVKSRTLNALPVPWIEPEDVSNVAVFLCSDEARYITGHVFAVDAGRNTLISATETPD